jgi:hypothetical protein
MLLAKKRWKMPANTIWIWSLNINYFNGILVDLWSTIQGSVVAYTRKAGSKPGQTHPDSLFASYPAHLGIAHRLINYKDTKAKCRHLKKLTFKGTLPEVFIKVYRVVIHSVMLVFSTQLCELLPLDPSHWFTSPPPFPKPKYSIYRQYEGVVWWGCSAGVSDQIQNQQNCIANPN